jgi:ABC-type dipeptide/oligopeptide/nickel transport system permease component
MLSAIMPIYLDGWWVFLVMICAAILAVVLGFVVGLLCKEYRMTDEKAGALGALAFLITVLPIFVLLIALFNGEPTSLG